METKQPKGDVMKHFIAPLLILFAGISGIFLEPAVHFKNLIKEKLRGDIRAANANERIALALERAYPIPAVAIDTISASASLSISSATFLQCKR